MVATSTLLALVDMIEDAGVLIWAFANQACRYFKASQKKDSLTKHSSENNGFG
jgi:hypothetical protein